MSKIIRIALADDSRLVRQSFAIALQTQKNFIIAFEASNGTELLQKLKEDPVDVIILDLQMPGINGWDVIERLWVEQKDFKIVIASSFLQEISINEMVGKGVRGFVSKDSDFSTLVSAIYEVNDLGYYFSPEIHKNVVAGLVLNKSIKPEFNKISKLTNRELHTLLLICEDKLTKEIAVNMSISERTVERYKSSLYVKTRAKTNAGLVLYALQEKLYNIRQLTN